MNRGAAKINAGRRIRLTSDTNDYDLHVMGDHLEDKPTQMIVFFAVTTVEFGVSVGRLLEDLKAQFYAAHSADAIKGATEKGVCHKSSANMLTALITKYGTNKVAEVQAAVDRVKDTMQENVAKTLENVEKLEDLEQKAEIVHNQAAQFEKGANTLKNVMRCKSWKTTAIIFAVVAGILLVIITPIAVRYSR